MTPTPRPVDTEGRLPEGSAGAGLAGTDTDTDQGQTQMPPPIPSTVAEATANPIVKGALASGGVGAAIVAVLLILAQFGVIGEGAQQKEAEALAARKATEESLVEMKMQLVDIRRSLEEIKRANETGLRKADFELYMERFARLNPSLQLPPSSHSPR